MSLFACISDAATTAVGRVAHGRHDLSFVGVALGDDKVELGVGAIQVVADGGCFAEKMVEGIFLTHAEGCSKDGEVFFLSRVFSRQG